MYPFQVRRRLQRRTESPIKLGKADVPRQKCNLYFRAIARRQRLNRIVGKMYGNRLESREVRSGGKFTAEFGDEAFGQQHSGHVGACEIR
ncbi:hypothetical protein D3C83_43520 [compost metagenome]